MRRKSSPESEKKTPSPQQAPSQKPNAQRPPSGMDLSSPLAPADIIHLQRTVGNQRVTQLLSDTAQRQLIQRQLNPTDEELFQAYVQEKTGGNIDEKLARTVRGVVRMSNSLAEAKQTINNVLMKSDFSKVQKLADTAPNSLASWLEEGDTLLSATNYVNVSNTDKAGVGKGGHILWTTSIHGCMGIAAQGNGMTFLAHWDPDQLKDEYLAQRIAELRKVVGSNAQIHLASKSVFNAPYIQAFKHQLANSGGTYQIVSEAAEERLAINAITGQVMHNFKIDELSTK